MRQQENRRNLEREIERRLQSDQWNQFIASKVIPAQQLQEKRSGFRLWYLMPAAAMLVFGLSWVFLFGLDSTSKSTAGQGKFVSYQQFLSNQVDGVYAQVFAATAERSAGQDMRLLVDGGMDDLIDDSILGR